MCWVARIVFHCKIVFSDDNEIYIYLSQTKETEEMNVHVLFVVMGSAKLVEEGRSLISCLLNIRFFCFFLPYLLGWQWEGDIV